MKKAFKIITVFILSIMTTLSFGACANKTGGGNDKIVIVRTKTLTVGYTDYKPMNYTDDNGVLKGFDTELALMVFNSLGYEVKFKLIDWSNKYTELEGRHCRLFVERIYRKRCRRRRRAKKRKGRFQRVLYDKRAMHSQKIIYPQPHFRGRFCRQSGGI